MHLHYLVKVKIRVFVQIVMLEKRNSKEILLIDFDIMQSGTHVPNLININLIL